MEKNAEKSADGRAWCYLVLCAAAAGIGMNALVSWLEWWRFSETYQRVREQQYAVSLWYGLLLYGVLAPIREEVIFRLIAFRLTERFAGWKKAMVFSALLFGIYHGNLIQGAYAFVMGLLLAYLYHWFHRFAAPVVFHGTANAVVFSLTRIPELLPAKLLPVIGIGGCVLAGGIIYWFEKRRRRMASVL